MSGETVIMRRAVDTFALSTSASRNFVEARRIGVQLDTALGFLHFDRAFPLKSTVVSAKLYLYTAGSWGGAPTVTVRRVGSDWRARRLTWDNKPSAGADLVSVTQSSAQDGHEWVIDVTSMMQTVANGGRWFGFRIEKSTAGLRYFHSAQADDLRPRLEVTWSTAPQQPTDLSPSGGRAVSLSHPTLRCDFTDFRGSTSMQAIHVQVDPTATWSAPQFNSGTVAATEPELDLATTAYAGATAGGATTKWRVRVQDGAGLWSPWSDNATFIRDLKGTLTITNPAAEPNNYVAEWTPPISWSLTGGETQKAWQVIIERDTDAGRTVHDTGRTKGTATSYTLPSGKLRDELEYIVRVRIWDSKDREHTPGDPVWTQTARAFSFQEDPTPNAVTSLAVSPLPPRPSMHLTWNRSTMPDTWVIQRDGEVVDSEIPGADLLTTGTSYAYLDRQVPGRRNHDWKVRAVVNGKTSPSPTVTGKTEQYGIWLDDRTRNIDVLILGLDGGQVDWAMGETGGEYRPPGGDHVIYVTQSLTGYEVTVTGELHDYAGYTARQWSDRAMRIKGRPENKLVLSVGDLAIPGRARRILTWPMREPGRWGISFEFAQSGRLTFNARI